MLIIIILISIVAVMIGIGLQENSYDFETFGLVLTIVGITGVVLTSIFFIDILLDYPYKIEEKITMYNEENENIESKIKETVEVYMNYEQETYQNLIQNVDLTTLVMKYPELNSNELVKSEIQTYKENNSKIKELKEKSIMKSTYDWWLYFGGN